MAVGEAAAAGAATGNPYLAAALIGASALSGLFGGLSQAKAQREQTKEQKREFDIAQAPGPTRLLETLPLRDRLLFLLNQRFGPSPTTYAASQAAYPGFGAGGAGRSQRIYEEMLKRMGYRVGGGFRPAFGPHANLNR